MFICIKLQDGSKIERSIKKPSVTLGRSPTADFVIPDESLSRFHAKIDIENGQYFITDLGSSNGVFLDGGRINPDQKVPFATYTALSIGPLECVIADELELNFPKEVEATKTSTQRTTSPLPKSRPERKAKKKSGGVSPDAILIGVGLIVAFAIYHIFTSEKNQNTKLAPAAQTETVVNGLTPQVAKPFKSRVLDQNTTPDLYLAHFREKTCTNMFDLCKELQIEDNKIEGFVKDGAELFIFVKPSKLFVHPRLAKLKTLPEAEDVLAHYLILGSSLLQLLTRHEFDQLHVIVISNVDQPVKAFRYHASKFEQGGIDVSGLIDALSAAIRTKQIKEVNETLEKFFPPVYLSNP